MKEAKAKRVLKVIVYGLGIVLGIGIINFGWKTANKIYGKYDDASYYEVDQGVTTTEMESVPSVSFGGDYFTEEHAALETINRNLSTLQQDQASNIKEILGSQQQVIYQISDLEDDVNRANVSIRQENTRNWEILMLIIGAVIVLVYIEKIVSLFSFARAKKPETVMIEKSEADGSISE